MCIRNIIRVVPEEDVKCYKVFRIDIMGEIHSPYHDLLWKPDVAVTATEGEVEPETSYDEIYGGVFHAFQNIEDAIAEKYAIKSYVKFMGVYGKGWVDTETYTSSQFGVFECTIPADAKHVYTGNYMSGVPRDCIASSKLILGKRIDLIVEAKPAFSLVSASSACVKVTNQMISLVPSVLV